MPLFANLTFRKVRFLVSLGSPTLTALNSLLEEIFLMIPPTRCSADTQLNFNEPVTTPEIKLISI